jgi:hypothetical protein
MRLEAVFACCIAFMAVLVEEETRASALTQVLAQKLELYLAKSSKEFETLVLQRDHCVCATVQSQAQSVKVDT